MSNPAKLCCSAPDGAGTAGVRQPAAAAAAVVAPPAGLQSLTVVAGPAGEGDKSQPGQPAGKDGDGEVSGIYIK